MKLWDFVQPLLRTSFPPSSPHTPFVPLSIRLLTFNIRYAANELFTNERPWPERFPLVLNELEHETRFLSGVSSNSTAFVCLQEVLHDQLVDILDGLNHLQPTETPKLAMLANGPIWGYVGVGRDDGMRKGEYSPIIYPVRLYSLLHSETVWLSPTPDIPSKGWDAGSIRILTVAIFEHKSTGQRLLACNTHLDNDGSVSRTKSVEIILGTIKRIQERWDDDSLPVFLAGDFNSFPDQEAYLAMHSSGLMRDVRELVKNENRHGNLITFTGFRPDKHKDEQGRIDFLWLGPKDAVHSRTIAGHEERASEGVEGNMDEPTARSWKVEGYSVLPNVYETGVYSSDHRPVVGDVTLL